jgi:hypothetical protein
MGFIHQPTGFGLLIMQANHTESANFSISSEFETPVAVGESLTASASLLSAATEPKHQERPEWAFLSEEDSSFFVPERCTALDDF